MLTALSQAPPPPTRPENYTDSEFTAWLEGFQQVGLAQSKDANASGKLTPLRVSNGEHFPLSSATLAYEVFMKGVRAFVRYDIPKLTKLGITSQNVNFKALHVFEMKNPMVSHATLSFLRELLLASKLTFAKNVTLQDVTKLLSVQMTPARVTPSKDGKMKAVKALTLADKLNKYAIDQKYAFVQLIRRTWRTENKLPDFSKAGKRTKGHKLSGSQSLGSQVTAVDSTEDMHESDQARIVEPKEMTVFASFGTGTILTEVVLGAMRPYAIFFCESLI